MSWTWWVVPGLVAALVAWAAAAVLLRTRPDRSLNRRLAAVLFLEGLWMTAGVFWLVEDPGLFVLIAAVGVAGMAAIPSQYLAFLGIALRTPLVATLRSRTAFILLGIASIGAALAVLVFPEAFIGDLYSPAWATWNFRFRPAGAVAAQVLGLASLFGLAASLHSYRLARPGTAARSQAKWFAIAFGVRDAFNVGWWLLYPAVRPIPFWGDFISNQGGAYFTIVYILLLAYGVLRVQLFDLDLRLKLAIRRGTIGAVFAVAFFTGSELLERVIPVEDTLLGLTLAGAIVLILRPVQRFAEALASRVMPGVKETADYIAAQKHAVYRAALEGVQEDRGISERERGILVRLREQLGLSEEQAGELELDVLARGV